MWNSRMQHHYQRAHPIFVELLGLKLDQKSRGLGLLGTEELKK
jgi:hypothetical protein